MMAESFPAPLVPPQVDLQDFTYMQLDVRRLRDSRISGQVTAEEFRCAILLWCAAWHQVPAASLPDDDIELANLAGYGRAVNEWKRHKAGALYGFVRCNDARFYHPTIAEKACDAWNEKQRYRYRKECDRIRKSNKERAERKLPALDFPAEPVRISVGKFEQFQRKDTYFPAESAPFSGGIPAEKALKGKGKGKGEGEVKGESKAFPCLSFPSEPPNTVPALSEKTGKTPVPRKKRGANREAKSAAVWEAYATAYAIRYNVEPVRNANVNAKLSHFCERIAIHEAPAVAAFYVRHNGASYVRSKHAVGLLLMDAEGLHTEWARGATVTNTEARQADETQALGNVFGKLIAEARANEEIE